MSSVEVYILMCVAPECGRPTFLGSSFVKNIRKVDEVLSFACPHCGEAYTYLLSKLEPKQVVFEPPSRIFPVVLRCEKDGCGSRMKVYTLAASEKSDPIPVKPVGEWTINKILCSEGHSPKEPLEELKSKLRVMSFELFVWRDEAWITTGRRFGRREEAVAAGKALGVTGLTKTYTPDFDVRESSEKPNQPSSD
jgi:hypothetical protein